MQEVNTFPADTEDAGHICLKTAPVDTQTVLVLGENEEAFSHAV